MAADVDRRARAVGAAHGVLRRGPESATGSRIVLDTRVTRMIPRSSLSAIKEWPHSAQTRRSGRSGRTAGWVKTGLRRLHRIKTPLFDFKRDFSALLAEIVGIRAWQERPTPVW